jgi:ornithine cyclodeaminase/alanine dehydrogenase
MALLLTRSDVQSLLTMPDAIKAVEEAFDAAAAGSVDMPQRAVIKIPGHGGSALFMPAHIGAMDALGIKVVTVYPENPTKYGKPTVLGVILLNDPSTGEVVAVMDGGYITAMRTGAVSGVATKYMAREDAEVAGVFGAGVQARMQLEAVAAVRKLKVVYVYDVVPEQRERFASEMSEKLGVPVHAVDDPRGAVEECDIICTATSAAEPVFKGEWLLAGTHINGIGSHARHMRELDTETIKRSRVIVDLKEAALQEAGDIIIPIKEGEVPEGHIAGELGDVITGKVEGRKSADEITLFKSVGLAIQDVSVASRVYHLARGQGVGHEIDF